MIPELPVLLTEKLQAYYPQHYEHILSGYHAERMTSLRVNTLKSSKAAVTEALDTACIPWKTVSWYEDALLMPPGSEEALQQLPLYEAGGIYLQNPSAMLPPLLMHPQPGENILDMAAAPGGKTTQLAALSGGKAMITACERDAVRCQRMQFNLQRQGAGRVNVMQIDSRRLDDFFSFDSILLDAPCTGSGTIRLYDGAYPVRMTGDWVKKITATQSAMLQKAMKLLRKGHEMVYSTCSILREENEQIVQKAMDQWGAELVPIDEKTFDGLPLLPVTLPGTLCVCPDAIHEGFYVAKLRKK